MLTKLSNSLAYSGYAVQQVSSALSTVLTPPDKAQDSEAKDKVSISREAQSLQSTYDKKQDQLEERYNTEAEQLEQEYLQDKSKLQREYTQKRQSLGISLVV